MKLTVKNPANIVSSAWCRKVSDLSFLLLINTTERYVFLGQKGGKSGLLRSA